MLKKKCLFFLILLLSTTIFGKINWEGEDGRISIIYKVLDPVIVTVDNISTIKANNLNKVFTYSSKNNGKRIDVNVKAPYMSDIDEYLRAIYEKVYFKLGNDGKFSLSNIERQNGPSIEAKGYFVDVNSNILESMKKTFYDKNFANQVSGDAFTAKTSIDVEFTLPEEELPMGVYRGVLDLYVWFGGTIK